MSHRIAIVLIIAFAASMATACGSPDGGHIAVAPEAEAASDGPVTHYVEFRARMGSLPYGHTYMVYGSLDETGEPADGTIVGLLPSAGFAGLLLGTVVDVPGIVGTSELDEVMPVLNVYRRPLTQAQYDRLLATIERARDDVPDWGLFGYNCNWFAGQLATSVGMIAPRDTSVASAFYVEALRTANDPEAADQAAQTVAGTPVER